MPTPSYLKRYRMERELREIPPIPELHGEFVWQAWSWDLLDLHAHVKYLSFRDEIDTCIFPSLGHRRGCGELMENIVTRVNFVPEATWLIMGPTGPCGTIQGVRDRRFGAIQNVGIVPEYRGRGLGKAMMLKALEGFRRAGLTRVYLEVTARNEGAVRLYRHLGFRSTRTIYKPVYTIHRSDECVVI